MNRDPIAECACAMAQIPGGLFILTSQYETRRAGVAVRWVQQCSDAPPMVMVAMYKGQPVEMLIRDSHFFALCQISADDRFLLHKFNGQRDTGSDDPLLPLMTRAAPSGCPVVDRALSYLDCEVVRHVELDCDHRIYVGQVHSGSVLNDGAPAIHYGPPGSGHGTNGASGNGSNGAPGSAA